MSDGVLLLPDLAPDGRDRVDHGGSGRPVARLEPFPDTGRVERFDRSFPRDSTAWKTFGPLGRRKLELDDAVDIVRDDPMFRVFANSEGFRGDDRSTS